MQSIGNKLEAARCKRGLSISEAAEATKIRGEFLSCFERDNFDFDLPEIYKSGFLRIYAQFLNINPERIVTDFKAYCLANTQKGFSNKNSSQALYGKTELPLAEVHTKDNMDSFVEKDEEETLNEDYSSKEKLLKGLVFAVLLTFFLVLLVLFYQWINNNDESLADTNLEIRNTEDLSAPIAEVNNRFYLIAKSGITVTVRDNETKEEILNQFLSAGEKKEIVYNKRVKITTNELQNIVIEKDGEQFATPGEFGPGTFIFPLGK